MSSRTENVAYVVVGWADDGIDVALVLAQHRDAIVIGVRIVRGSTWPAATEIITGVG